MGITKMVNPLHMMVSNRGVLCTRRLKGGPTKGDPFVPDINQRVDSLHIIIICRWPLVIFYYFSYFIFSDHSFPSLTSSPHLSLRKYQNAYLWQQVMLQNIWLTIRQMLSQDIQLGRITLINRIHEMDSEISK